MDWGAIAADVRVNWMLYASMPVVAAVIGYVTKIVAIRMMFEPIDFVGIKPPYLGWQGIVPRNAERMATIACDTMTTRLLKPGDVFGKLDPHRVARELQEPMLAAVEEIAHEVAQQYQPGLWQRMPERLRDGIVGRIKAESPGIVRRIMQDLQRNIDSFFDLKEMVIGALMKDRRLLNRIFQEAGHKEFDFIRNSGLWFGFFIGCVQALTWATTHSSWVMPVFGGFTGWFTDWLALKMIFNPKQPTKYFGLIEWQGLFLKRRKEVAADYGALIASEVITPAAVLGAVLRGPASDKLYELVVKHVKDAVDAQSGMARPLVEFALGSARYKEMKDAVAQRIMMRLPETLVHVEAYAGDAMDLKNTLTAKMQELTAEEFEALLRPAFQQDEWILIAVGAALGFLVGELQVFVMLHMGH